MKTEGDKKEVPIKRRDVREKGVEMDEYLTSLEVRARW